MNSMSLPDVHKFILKSISMFCFSLNPPNPNFSSDCAHMHGNPTTHLIMQGIRIIGSIGSEPAPSSHHTAKLHMFPQVGDSEKMVKTWKNSTMWHSLIVMLLLWGRYWVAVLWNQPGFERIDGSICIEYVHYLFSITQLPKWFEEDLAVVLVYLFMFNKVKYCPRVHSWFA